jgi:hypothetical protein
MDRERAQFLSVAISDLDKEASGKDDDEFLSVSDSCFSSSSSFDDTERSSSLDISSSSSPPVSKPSLLSLVKGVSGSTEGAFSSGKRVM